MSKAAAAACVGLACAGAPKIYTEAPEKPCPPEIVKWMGDNGILIGKMIGDDSSLTLVLNSGWADVVPVPPAGPLVILSFNSFSGLGSEPRVFPVGSRLLGQAFRGKDRLYGWLTEVVTPDGTRYPICGNLVSPSNQEEMGVPYDRSSTPEKPMMDPYVTVIGARRFGIYK